MKHNKINRNEGIQLALRLMGSPSGSFMIDSMFMTSHYSEHDFSTIAMLVSKGDMR